MSERPIIHHWPLSCVAFGTELLALVPHLLASRLLLFRFQNLTPPRQASRTRTPGPHDPDAFPLAVVRRDAVLERQDLGLRRPRRAREARVLEDPVDPGHLAEMPARVLVVRVKRRADPPVAARLPGRAGLVRGAAEVDVREVDGVGAEALRVLVQVLQAGDPVRPRRELADLSIKETLHQR